MSVGLALCVRAPETGVGSKQRMKEAVLKGAKPETTIESGK